MNILPATVTPLATQEIDGMLEMIQTLIDKEYAYVAADGTVYYRTRKFAQYGKLSHKNLDDLRTGERELKVSGQDQKEDPLDFVLWKPKKEGEPVSKVSIKLEGSTFEVEIPESHDTVILDAALEQGIDAPYSCKGGMCCTCKAKLLEGEVSMDVHWGLEDDEVRNGFILTCQSHPKTMNVKIDYDIK